MVSEILTQK